MIASRDAPSRVRKAIALLWAAVLIGLAEVLYFAINPEPETVELRDILFWFAVAFVLIYAVFVYFASRRRNWARFVLLLFAVGDVALYVAFPDAYSDRWWDIALCLGCIALEVVALYLLFTGSAALWYAEQRESIGAF